MPAHQLVEGRLGIEHHGPELAAARIDAGLGVELRVHLALLVSELRQAERVREPLCRVDGEHRNLLPPSRHPGGDGSRARRLAHAARAGADADALAVEELADPGHQSMPPESSRISSTPSSGLNTNGRIL